MKHTHILHFYYSFYSHILQLYFYKSPKLKIIQTHTHIKHLESTKQASQNSQINLENLLGTQEQC
jgi:hypothetical protein